MSFNQLTFGGFRKKWSDNPFIIGSTIKLNSAQRKDYYPSGIAQEPHKHNHLWGDQTGSTRTFWFMNRDLFGRTWVYFWKLITDSLCWFSHRRLIKSP